MKRDVDAATLKRLLSNKDFDSVCEEVLTPKFSSWQRRIVFDAWRKRHNKPASYTSVIRRRVQVRLIARSKEGRAASKAYLDEHNYITPGKRRTWTVDDYRKFIRLNDAGTTAPELARIFKTSIPTIASFRRKLKMSRTLSRDPKRVLILVRRAEAGLRKMVRAR